MAPATHTGSDAASIAGERIWRCKIGGRCDDFPVGADAPMRDAIADAFKEVTGREPEFIFSGWAATLTEGERAVVENRMPDYDKVMAERGNAAGATAMRAEVLKILGRELDSVTALRIAELVMRVEV